jgi:hypothetical protein
MPAAANFDFPGGIEKLEIADADDFDTSGNSTFAITMDRNKIAEGSEIPDPEAVTIALADDRELNNGKDQELNLRFTSMETTDFDSLEQAEQNGTELFIRITSLKTDNNSNPVWEVVYKRVILSFVAHGPAKADRSEYGVVIVNGMTTGGDTEDIYSITKN